MSGCAVPSETLTLSELMAGLEQIIQKHTEFTDIKQRDASGNSIIHLLTKQRVTYELESVLLVRHLFNIDIYAENHDGKMASDYVSKSEVMTEEGSSGDDDDVPDSEKSSYNACKLKDQKLYKLFEMAYKDDILSSDERHRLKAYFALVRLTEPELYQIIINNRAAGNQLIERAKLGKFASVVSTELVNYQDPHGDTILYHAVKQKNYTAARSLVKTGARYGDGFIFAPGKDPLAALLFVDSLSPHDIDFIYFLANHNAAVFIGDLATRPLHKFIGNLVRRHIIDQTFLPPDNSTCADQDLYACIKASEARYLFLDCNFTLYDRRSEKNRSSMKVLQARVLEMHRQFVATDAFIAALSDSLESPISADALKQVAADISQICATLIPWQLQQNATIHTVFAQPEVFALEVEMRFLNIHYSVICIVSMEKLYYYKPASCGEKIQLQIYEFKTASQRSAFKDHLQQHLGSPKERMLWERELLSFAKLVSTEVFAPYYEAITPLLQLYGPILHYSLAQQLPNAWHTKLATKWVLLFKKIYLYQQGLVYHRYNTLAYSHSGRPQVDQEHLMQYIVTARFHTEYLESVKDNIVANEQQITDYADVLSICGDEDQIRKYLSLLHRLGIADKVGIWVRPHHVIALYLGYSDTQVQALNEAQLLAISLHGLGADEVTYAHFSVPHLAMIKRYPNIDLDVLYYMTQPEIAQLLGEEAPKLLQFDKYIADARNYQLSFDEQLLLRASPVITVDDLRTESVFASLVASVGYEHAISVPQWPLLLAYILQRPIIEQLEHIYGLSINKLRPLNLLQRLGLYYGFNYDEVCSEKYDLVKFAAVIYCGLNPHLIIKHTDFCVIDLCDKPLDQFIAQHKDYILDGMQPFIQAATLSADRLMQPETGSCEDVSLMSFRSVAPADVKPVQENISYSLQESSTGLLSSDTQTSLHSEFLAACKLQDWPGANVLLSSITTLITNDETPGGSPFEYIAYADKINPEYHKLLRALVDKLGGALNIGFYSDYNIYNTFMGALAATHPLTRSFHPNAADSPAYHQFYTVLYGMQISIILHSHMESVSWYDTYSGVAFKSTGTSSQIMHAALLNYHLEMQRSDNEFYNLLAEHVTVANPTLFTDANRRIDHIMQQFIPSTLEYVDELQRKIQAREPVVFGIELMFELYPHNICAYIVSGFMLIADPAVDNQEITVFQINDYHKLASDVKQIFGERVELELYDNFLKNTSITMVKKIPMQSQRAFNCSMASMVGLYQVIILCEMAFNHVGLIPIYSAHLPAALRKQILDAMDIFDKFARKWAVAIEKYGIYFCLRVLGMQKKYEYDVPHLLYCMAAQMPFSDDDVAGTCRQQFLYQYHARHISAADAAGLDLTNAEYEDLIRRDILHTIFDLGPKGLAYYRQGYTNAQISGLNYGLQVEVVTAPGFNVIGARAMLFHDPKAVCKLSDHQKLALREGVPLEIASQRWFTDEHYNAFMKLKLAPASLYAYDRAVLALAHEHRFLLTCKRHSVSVGHASALKRLGSKLSAQEAFSLPAPQALGIALGLSIHQVYDPRFSLNTAYCIMKGIMYEEAINLSFQQMRIIIYCDHPVSLHLIQQAECNYQQCLAVTLGIDFNDICSTVAARRAALAKLYANPGFDREKIMAPTFNWLRLVALLKLPGHIAWSIPEEQIIPSLLGMTLGTTIDSTDPELSLIKMQLCTEAYGYSMPEVASLNLAQAYCILRGNLTLEEVQQPWFGEEFYHARRIYNADLRSFIGVLDNTGVKALLDEWRRPPEWLTERLAKQGPSTSSLPELKDHKIRVEKVDVKRARYNVKKR